MISIIYSTMCNMVEHQNDNDTDNNDNDHCCVDSYYYLMMTTPVIASSLFNGRPAAEKKPSFKQVFFFSADRHQSLDLTDDGELS